MLGIRNDQEEYKNQKMFEYDQNTLYKCEIVKEYISKQLIIFIVKLDMECVYPHLNSFTDYMKEQKHQ